MIGKIISHYQILDKLGGGGMGVVYKARDAKLDRFVALKFLPPHLSTNEEAKQRFINEAKAASALDHPNIATIHEINETDDGQMFIAMAYYDGETLKKRIERGPLPIAEAMGIAEQIARGLERAHEEGIIHRDIKPANILITKRNEVKIVDFGLARLTGSAQITKTGTTMGTLAYMSPEQIQGEDVDRRTDLWSLGVVLYEMLTARLPFKGEFDQAVAYLILQQDPKPVAALRSDVPLALGQVVEKLLRKDAGERYQPAGEVLTDLQSLKQLPASGKLTGRSVVASRSRQHRGWLYGGMALIMFVLLLIAGQRFLAIPKHRDENIRSIAVLPMSNRSGDPDQEHIVDGMTDLLINNLSRLKGLERVISHTTMKRYKQSDKSLREIGRELKVDALIEASVLSDREQALERPLDEPEIPATLDWGLWLGPAPYRPYHPAYVPFLWRGWWDFGEGGLGDMGIHNIAPAFSALKLQAPTSVHSSSTPVYKETFPWASVVHFEFPARGDMPPVKLHWYDGGILPERPQELEDGRELPKEDGMLFVGDKGKILVTGWGGESPRLIPESKMQAYKLPAKTLPRSIGHHQEWIEACKTGAPTRSNFDFAGPLTEAVLLGLISVRLGGKNLYWDSQNLMVKNSPEANELLHYQYREGWNL